MCVCVCVCDCVCVCVCDCVCVSIKDGYLPIEIVKLVHVLNTKVCQFTDEGERQGRTQLLPNCREHMTVT